MIHEIIGGSFYHRYNQLANNGKRDKVKTIELVVQTAPQAVTPPISQEKRYGGKVVVLATLPSISLWMATVTLPLTNACSVGSQEVKEREEQLQEGKYY